MTRLFRHRSRGGGQAAVVALALAMAIVGALVFIQLASDWLAVTDASMTASQRAEEIGRARTTVLAVLAGCLAAVGAYYTHRSFGLSRQGQITERFTRAVDQLGNGDSRDVRLGGIYALERLARESRDDHGPVVEILTAYIREHAPRPPEDVELERMARGEYPGPTPTDVQAALTVLGRRNRNHDPPLPWRLDLSRAYLPNVDLRNAYLRGANLSGAVLDTAHASGADFGGARLVGARLHAIDARHAQFVGADLSSAQMRRARLDRARMHDAVLARAVLADAQMEGAFMQRVDLDDADLSRADLRIADMAHASLVGATLTEALLGGTKLQDALLEGAQLEDARYSKLTAWPPGLDVETTKAVQVSG